MVSRRAQGSYEEGGWVGVFDSAAGGSVISERIPELAAAPQGGVKRTGLPTAHVLVDISLLGQSRGNRYKLGLRSI